MQLMTNNNILYTIRMMVLVMLFQLLSPAVFALVSDPVEKGHFSTICTMQGYKQLWIAPNDEKKDLDLSKLNCPYCLLNLGAVDGINSNTEYYLNLVDSFSDDLLTVQSKNQLEVLSKSLPIRAPPCLS